MPLPYDIQYFNPGVQAEIERWPADLLASYARLIELLAEYGPEIGMPYSKAMGQGLFELRPKSSTTTGRAFFTYLVGQRIVILHAFIKKTPRTPIRALELARKRQKAVQRG